MLVSFAPAPIGADSRENAMLLSVGSCVVDTASLSLKRDGEPVSVEPQVFDLIVLLLTNGHRVVSRQEIIDRIWSGRIMSDAAISTCVKAARRALGDDGTSQRVIRTAHRRGFRVVAPVTVVDQPSGATSKQATYANGRSGDLAPIDADADLATGDLKPPRELSIAVLPFDTPGATEGADIIARGFVDDIITRLGRTRRLFVIGRGTVFALPRRSQDPRETAAALGVRYALCGSVQFDGRRVRLTISLVEPGQPYELWAERFDRDVGDLFSVQDELAEIAVSRAYAEIEQAEQQKALMRPIGNLDAWSAYHRARWHLDRHTADDYDLAANLLQRAASLDPGSARVFAGLSFVHRQRAFLNLTGDREGEVRRALDLARHSLSLEPHDPQAHWALGRALMLRMEVEAARQEFELTTSLNPSFAMGQYSVGFARSMLGMTRPSDEALAKSRRLSPIDPMRFAMLATHAFNEVLSQRRERALELAQLAAAQPHAHVHILAIAALCAALAERPPVAANYLNRLREARPNYRRDDFFAAFPFQSPDHVAEFRTGFDRLGMPR